MNEWHVTGALAAGYVAERLDEAGTWSLEAHVERCGRCARLVSSAVDDPMLGRSRGRMLLEVRAPSRGFLRLTAAPTLSRGWLLAVTGVVAGVLVLDLLDATRLPLLLLVAPLLPLLGLALGCAPSVDGASELWASTPTSALRLLLLRAAAVLVVSVLPLLAASLVTGVGPLRWLAPSAGLVSLSLAASIVVRVEVATGCAGALWAGVALGPAVLTRQIPIALTTPALVAWAAAAALCLLTLVAGRDRLGRTGATR